MSKRWLGLCVLFVLVGWSRIASATLSISPSPVPIGSVTVATTGSASATISESGGAETIASWDFTAAGCHDASSNQLFDVTATLPLTVNNGNPKTVSVTFTPTAIGAASCQIVGKDAGGTALLTFTATGTGVAPVISVSPSGPVNFGSVRVANASTTTLSQVFTLSNTGSGTLSITDISFSGTNAGDFTLQPTTFPIDITTGTATVTVVFDPSAAGARSATMNIASNDPATPTKSIALSGTGTNAVINVSDVNFGIVSDTTTANQNVSITNVGAAPKGPLTVTSATISGGSFFTFGVGNGCNGGTSCTFTQPFVANANTLTAPVRCSPPAAASGTQTATVTFVSDSDAGGTTIANLMCTAGRPNIMVDKSALAFGNQLVNTSSPAQVVTITNTGNTTLNYSLVKSPNASQYAITGCVTACTVPGGMTAQFSVVFTPTAPGALNITININNNDPDPGDNTFPIAVTGTGIAPDITVTTTNPMAFGNVEVGQVSGMLPLTVQNIGSSDLTITNALLTSGVTDYSVLSGTTGAQMTVIPPGMTATWQLVCDPSQAGSRPGNFRITSNAFSGSTTNVSLSCTGQAGILTVSPPSIDFGGVAMGTSKTLTYTLSNTGNLAVSGITGVLDVTTVGYSLDPTTPIPTSLNPGASATLKVIFAPMAGTDGGLAHVTFTGTWGAGPTTTTAVLTINGDGLTAGYDVTPPTVDFGNLRFDTTPTKTFCIINTQQAAVTIFNNISISPHAGTITGEFTITGVKRETACGGSGSAVVLPQTLAQSDVLEVTVKADPATRIGAMAADLTVTSDLAMNPTRTILLQGNATTAAITLAPGSTLDFGAVDVDAGPVTQTLSITNSGDGPLDLSSFSKTASTVFTVTLPTGTTTLAPTGHVDLAITYDPTVDRPAGQFDTMVITHAIAGVLNGPSLEMLQIQGRGIDRHIDAVAPTVPDAYRNPGNDAPVVQVPVMNLGEANLHVSAVMVSGDPVWAVVDASPFDVGAFGSASVLVRFAPIDYGPAPAGQLVIMNNDNGNPMVRIDLHGNGLNRMIDLGPNLIDFGYVGLGIPSTKADALQVASMNAMRPFSIDHIELDGDAVFSIDNAPSGVMLDPLAMKTFSVTFTPETEGDFHATALLFVTPDPLYQDKIDITGHAVYVDAHGGGGCSAGGSAGAAMILVIALVVVRRRRTAVVALALVAMPAAARADNVDLTVFHPTPATSNDGFQLQSAEVGANGDWVALAVLSLATDPLVLTAYDLKDGQHVLLNQQTAVQLRTQYELGGAYAFLGRFEAGLRLPLYRQSGQEIPSDMMMFGDPPPKGTAVGDLTLHGKARFITTPIAALGAGLSLTLPTASDGQYAGVDKPSGRLLALGTFTPTRRLTLTANAGAVIRAHATFANVDQRSGFAFGGGASFRLLDSVWFATELYGDLIPSGTHGTDAMKTVQTLSPMEWLAGFNYRIQPQWTVGLAVGRGVTNSFGSPAVRGVFELSFAPGARALPPLHAPVIDGDRDGDGIPDSIDKCPDEPEDFDMFEDQDGCPDPDNDHDGIPDAQDKCPLDPEDFDGFQDADGCPDPDNDGDGIPDKFDKCPNEPEDKDGFEDLDGCPDPDNDHDGIPDEKDKCPNEPETINGYQDEDGCPDKGDPLVVISPDRLDLLDAIQFTGAKLKPASNNLLGQIGAQLRAHIEITRLRITVHVQPTRDPDRDQDVSDKRAQAVRDWLVKWGIAPTRLEARGFGSTRPLVPATQRNAFQMNERVELIILERK